MIVGINGNSVLKFNMIVESNHIKLELMKGTLNQIEEFISNFNALIWEEKASKVSTIDVGEDEDITRNKIKDYIVRETDLSQYSIDDFVYKEEDLSNIRSYDGDSINIIDNLKYFVNLILPKEVIDMLTDANDNIKYLDASIPLSDFISGISEYVVYMGPNPKYRGCIGKIVKTRDDVASLLVEFPNKFRESGRIARFWSKPINVLSFKNE